MLRGVDIKVTNLGQNPPVLQFLKITVYPRSQQFVIDRVAGFLVCNIFACDGEMEFYGTASIDVYYSPGYKVCALSF